jgi:DNA-directed RNA polymerase subunit beta'
MSHSRAFDSIRIEIASPETIRSWSRGEVRKPETINYRTFKPERDGLFCERIFGPVKDWECHCGRYKKIKFKGIICDRCGVEVTRSSVRRERMGHIDLAAPVCHIWYLKGVPSPLSLLLDISPRPLEKVIYFASYVVTRYDAARIAAGAEEIGQVAQQEIAQMEERLRTDIERLEAEKTKKPKKKKKTEDDLFALGISEEELTPEERAKQIDDRIAQIKKDIEEQIKILGESQKKLAELDKKALLTEDEYRGVEFLLEVVNRRLEAKYAGAFEAGLGAEAAKKLLQEIDLEDLSRQLREEIRSTAGPRRAKAIKRLEVANALIEAKIRPEWMILEAIPVISPELRPMVQLDGGRFATSDLNDLYRRIINRNNRLKKIREIRAPESIVNHEKRLLQEAVDALIDNGRRSHPVVGSNNRPLKSLSDLLKGKEGRFRKNLLGKRVDYSGRSVIVVGPNLKLHQCGLPKEMALELFKPFVIKTLVERGFTSNIKTAKHMIDKQRDEVWDALEEVIREHPVLLNRAPTLHRLGIQAFEPILIDGKAIQIHPLVCHAYNADFDGDQMAVHVPLSLAAQAEARILMLSSNNLFSPADGRPIVTPIQDIVLGLYYLTIKREGQQPVEMFASWDDAVLAYDSGKLDLHDMILVRAEQTAPGRISGNGEGDGEAPPGHIETTVGRIIFNQILPANMRFCDQLMDKKAIEDVVTLCHRLNGPDATIALLDDLKRLGYTFATRSGVTISMTDMDIPAKRDEIVTETEKQVTQRNEEWEQGMITQGERKQRVLELWTSAADKVHEAIMESIDPFNPINMITTSGARGSKRQITQLAGMRGLMSDPFGALIEDLPIKSNFHEGLSVLEYFISTHGARKGLADTALRTADAGYLTRRLVDVAQDVIVRVVDCGTTTGIRVSKITDRGDIVETLAERIRGRFAFEPILHPETGEVIVDANEEITDEKAVLIDSLGIRNIPIRSPLTCEQRQGICSMCYGRDLATGRPADVGLAGGIIAAQSIGEPGTQLTMRTFHTGGIAGEYLTGVAEVKKRRQESLRELHDDIKQGLVSFEESLERERIRQIQAVLKVLEEQVRGLLRVVELFEARKPKGQAIITEHAGKVVDIETRGLKRVVIHAELPSDDTQGLVGETIAEGARDSDGEVVVKAGTEISERVLKKLRSAGDDSVKIRKTHLVPYRGNLEVGVGDEVTPGDRLTEGPLDPQRVLELQGVRGVQNYLVAEIQKVYKSQGVDINDKHIEIIVRQMLRRRRIIDPGDTRFLPGRVVDRFQFESENTRVREANPKAKEATAEWILLGITEASLATESFLSAASFQKTTRVLTEAAVRGKVDPLLGLKENVIIGRLIPAGTGLRDFSSVGIELIGDDFIVTQSPEEEEAPELDLAKGLLQLGEGVIAVKGEPEEESAEEPEEEEETEAVVVPFFGDDDPGTGLLSVGDEDDQEADEMDLSGPKAADEEL